MRVSNHIVYDTRRISTMLLNDKEFLKSLKGRLGAAIVSPRITGTSSIADARRRNGQPPWLRKA